MKTRLLSLATALLLIIGTTQAQDEKPVKEPTYMPAQISFIPGFGTAGIQSRLVATNVSLNILGGYVYSVHGVEMGSLINIIHNDLKGAQLSGLVNVVGNDATGAQMAGLANVTIGEFKGAQMAGLTNVTVGNSQGAQMSGMANATVGHTRGGQLSGLANYSNGVNGVQAAGLVNASVDSLGGGQIAGLANYAGSVKGIQAAGLLNISTKEIDGAQVSGLINFAPRVKGLQIGVVNIADSVERGAVIGLFNFVRTGMHKFEVSHEDVMDFNFSFRGGTERFYSIWTVGIKPQDEAFWSIGAGFGTQFDIKSKIYTNVEATTSWLQLTDNQNLDGDYSLSKFNVNVGYKINDYLSVNAGPVLNVFVENSKDDPADNPLVNIGNDNFYDKKVNDSNVKMWLGYRVAFRF